jgi:hypothetical protein
MKETDVGAAFEDVFRGRPAAYRLRKFSSEKGSASLEILLTLDLPRARMSEDGEPSDEREDEGGPCVFEGGPPCSSVGSVGMTG